MFERSPDSKKIDGSFKFFINSQSAVASVECKNHNNSIGTPKLTEILEKSLAAEAKLCFIFCNICVQSTTEKNYFLYLTRSEPINVYRILESESKHCFEIVPFDNNIEICKNPALVCIIIECNNINNI